MNGRGLVVSLRSGVTKEDCFAWFMGDRQGSGDRRFSLPCPRSRFILADGPHPAFRNAEVRCRSKSFFLDSLQQEGITAFTWPGSPPTPEHPYAPTRKASITGVTNYFSLNFLPCINIALAMTSTTASSKNMACEIVHPSTLLSILLGIHRVSKSKRKCGTCSPKISSERAWKVCLRKTK